MAAAGAKAQEERAVPGHQATERADHRRVRIAAGSQTIALGWPANHAAASIKATCTHEEPGVAQGEFEANAQPRRPIHARLPRARCLGLCRCGTRRRQRWR